MSVAFELRESVKDLDPQTQIALADGETYEVGQALTNGPVVLNPEPQAPKGREPTDEERERAERDRQIVSVLDQYPAAKRTSVPEPKSEKKGDG